MPSCTPWEIAAPVGAGEEVAGFEVPEAGEELPDGLVVAAPPVVPGAVVAGLVVAPADEPVADPPVVDEPLPLPLEPEELPPPIHEVSVPVAVKGAVWAVAPVESFSVPIRVAVELTTQVI